METMTKLKEQWISLDMPDPATNWPEMLACVLFVAFFAVVLITACIVGGVL
jgi:hypothetical protein